MSRKLQFQLPGRATLRRVTGWITGRVMGLGLPSLFAAPFLVLLATVGFTSPSLAQEPVFSNNGMRWEGWAVGEAAAANALDQDRSVLALDTARNLEPDSQLILPEPDADEVARRMATGEDADRRPQQTGFTRAVQGFAQLAPSPAGTRRGSDGQDYAVSQRLVGSAGAVSMRLHFADVHLPAGARLYVYGLADDGRQHNTQQRGYDNAWLGDRTDFWSHTIPGDRAVVEYHTPLDGGATGSPAVYTVDRVVHNVVDAFGYTDATASSTAAGEADIADCHNDLCTYPAWRNIGDGVVHLVFINNGDSFRCSGSLLNDQAGSGTPYIYTAAHCIATQSVASTVEVSYFWQRNLCSDTPEDNRVTHMGTTLLATVGQSSFPGIVLRADYTLLQADTAPPNGVMFLGWTTDDIAVNTQGASIHHPEGSPKQISFGRKIQHGNEFAHVIIWSNGIAERGSSGSPFIIGGPNATRARVIGAASTASPERSCDIQQAASYGRLSLAWPSFAPFLLSTLSTDLIVDSVSVSEATPETGVSITINATVRNDGATESSAATTLHYYRSADSTITTADTELTTDEVGRLAANGTSQESAEVSIADPGSYWVGACVDPVSGEADTDNNCSTGVEVTVTAPAPTLPDLTVTNVSVSDSTPRPGASFTINATVQNSGNGAAAATTLRYYRSADNTITTTDTPLGTDPVGGLSAGGSSRENTTVSIANARTWWVGACVDTVADEVVRTNNCSDGVEVNITAPPVVPPTRPDLTVDTASVSNSTPRPGASFTISATARNSGNGGSPATTLFYYRSANSTIKRSDTQLATRTIGGLVPNGSSQQSATVSITNTGAWWVGACVGTVSGEADTDNNCSTGVRVNVTAAPPPVVPPTRPDLTVDTVSVSDASVETGSTFTISANAQNSGNGASPATTLRYYRSTDDTITTDDNELTTDPVGALAPGAASPESAAVSIANTGNYWVGACVDRVNSETNTNNNCSNGVRVSVTAPPPVMPPTRPDLTVDTVSISDTSVETGASFTINATVRNRGTGTSPVATLRYVRSDDSTITASDPVITTETVGALVADGSSPQSAAVSIADAGNYWLGACVDTVDSEADTNNNCSNGVQISVTVPAVPDLTADSVGVSESTVEVGDSFTVTATVQNTGNGAAAATTLRYYRSDDSTITASNFELATEPVAGLAGDDASTHTTTVAISDAGTYWVGVCVDAVSDETARDNNCSAGVQVSVTEPADHSGILPAIFRLLLLP